MGVKVGEKGGTLFTRMVMILEVMLTEWMRDVFGRVFQGAPGEWDRITVVATTTEEFGDYQCNAAMGLARSLRKKPIEIAQAVQAHVQADLPPFLAKVEIAGPGFLNLFLKTDWIAEQAVAQSGDSRQGVPEVGAGKTLIIDYSSPNVAKPMHIGHIRSTVIGNALDRLYRFLGFRVLADNHIGDWGTQFGLLIMGYRNFVDQQALAENPIEELERLYVKSYEQSKQSEAWLEQARQELVKLQAGDVENHKLWSEFIRLSLAEFDRIYKRLGVSFDLVRGESYYHDQLQGMIDRVSR